MKLNSLIIGDLEAKVPIIQGGMGVGVSLSSLAGAVAKEGAIGVISAAQPGFLEEDFGKDSLTANIRALGKHIKKAKEISNGGIIGDSNEINKTTGLGIHLYSENIKNLINSKVYNMLDNLDIDVLGVSVDSLMIIVSEEESDTIIRLLNENKIKTDVIGKITNTGKTYLEDESGNIKQLVPKFREAAYTPIKKVIDSINEVDFEENKKTINHATVESIKKKDEIVSWIKSRYE